MTSTEDWTRMSEALLAFGDAYLNWLQVQAEKRSNSAEYRVAQERFEAAAEERKQAALSYAQEGETVGAVIQRYYAENLTTKVQKGRKR